MLLNSLMTPWLAPVARSLKRLFVLIILTTLDAAEAGICWLQVPFGRFKSLSDTTKDYFLMFTLS